MCKDEWFSCPKNINKVGSKLTALQHVRQWVKMFPGRSLLRPFKRARVQTEKRPVQLGHRPDEAPPVVVC